MRRVKIGRYHEGVRETRVPDIVSDSGDTQREEIFVCQARQEWIALVPIAFPHSAILQQNGYARNDTRTVQEEIHSLKYVQCMLEVVIRVSLSIQLTEML